MTAFNIPVNKKWWLLLNLSALGFIIFPLLGALVPFIIWRTNPDKIKGIETEARQLINFQLWWCLLLFFVFLAFLYAKCIICRYLAREGCSTTCFPACIC